MRIIKNEPAANGAYPPLQTWTGLVPPEGFYQWPDSLNTENFYNYNGFVTLTTARNIVLSYEPNVEAWEEWQSSLPPEPEPEVSDTEVLNTLLGVIDDE